MFSVHGRHEQGLVDRRCAARDPHPAGPDLRVLRPGRREASADRCGLDAPGNTNDGFSPASPASTATASKGTLELDVRGYDAGSEKNNEKKGFLGALGAGNDRDPENGVITYHTGIRGDADAPKDWNWDVNGFGRARDPRSREVSDTKAGRAGARPAHLAEGKTMMKRESIAFEGTICELKRGGWAARGLAGRPTGMGSWPRRSSPKAFETEESCDAWLRRRQPGSRLGQRLDHGECAERGLSWRSGTAVHTTSSL